MARITYITNGMASTLNASLELSRRLEADGHEVVYLSHEAIGSAVREHGFRFRQLVRDRELRQRLSAEPDRPLSLGKLPSWLRTRRAIRSESLAHDELERALADLAPDLLLIDLEMHYAVLATAHLGIPRALVNVFFTVYRAPGLPPLHTRLRPATSGKGRSAIARAWWRERLASFKRVQQRRLAALAEGAFLQPVTYGAYHLEELAAVARARGVSLRRETDRSHWLRPYVYRRLPVLCLNALELELPHAPWPRLEYVGPMIRHDRRQSGDASEASERWERFAAGRTPRAGAGRPLVYCSLGTFWAADREMLRHVVDVFRRRADWDLVLGLGGKLSADALGVVPDNVLALEVAPQLDVLARADCAITHGGVTTLNECIDLAVPMVVCSTGHVDQNGNAVRVGFHGLGIVADPPVDSAALEWHVERALTDERIAQRLAGMQGVFREYTRSRRAEHAVERLLAAG